MIIGTNFKLSSAKFLDDRQLCKDYNTLITNAEGIIYPPGFEVFCEYENKYYQYVLSSEGEYIWEERRSGVSDGESASIKDDTISEKYTWSSAHIDSMRIDLETLITQANDYTDEIDERVLYIEGKLQWFENFDGSYESLTNKPVIPKKISELEDDIDIEGLKNNSHTHINKDILETITEEMINNWNNNVSKIENYNDLFNKPIENIGIDIDLTLNPNDLNKNIYLIKGIICGIQFTNELCIVEPNETKEDIKIIMLNSMKKIVIHKENEDWSVIEEENYGIDKNNAKISNSLNIGEGNIIKENNQIVQGRFNEEDVEEKYINIIGNGTSEEDRKNIHTLDWEGNGWYGGKLSQEGVPTEDKDLITKGYADNKYETIENVNSIVNTVNTRIENINTCIDNINKENARRDVIIEALANGRRRTVETDGNDVDLMFSTEKDKVWIDKIEGDTMVNVCDQEEPIAITKSYTVEGTNHVPLQGEYDGKARPVVQGNTLVNHNREYDKSIIIGERINNRQGTEILNLEGTPDCEIKVDIDGYTAINLSTKKEDVLCKSFDSVGGNEINLVAEENSVSDLVIQGNTMVNLANIHLTNFHWGDRELLQELKPNTIYTFVVDISNPTMDSTYYVGILDKNNESGWSCLIDNLASGNNIFTMITNDTPSSTCRISGVKVEAYADFDIMIFEGDLTQTPELIPTEYVEGLQSTFEDKLIPYSIYNGDNLTSITETQYQLPLTVKSNTQYTVTTTANTTKYQYAVYSTDGLTEYLSYDTTVTTQTFTCDTSNVLFKVRMNPSYSGDDYSFVLDEVKDKFLIVEGDWSGKLDLLTEDYFGKYRVDMSSCGKNKVLLYRENCFYGHDSGFMFNSATHDAYIASIKPNTSYVISFVNGNRGDISNICFWSNTMQYISGIPFNVDTNVFTTPSNVKFITIAVGRQIVNLQIEEGTQATEYEPYHGSSKTVYLNSPLLNGDELLTKDGKLYHYHKMGMVVLDGSEDWEIAEGDYFRVYTTLSNLGKSDFENNCWNNFSNNFIPAKDASYLKNSFYISNINGTIPRLYIYFDESKLSTTDLTGFKQWLSENPTTVVYELASPYYEEISSTEDMRFNISTNSTLEYQSNVPMANTQFLPYRNELPLLESSTQYRVTFDCDVEGLELMVSLGGTSQTITSGLHNELSFITPSLQTDGKLTIDGYGIAKIDNVLITSGSMKYKYFEGLKSGFEDNKINLYDMSKIETDNNYSQTFSITNDNHMILKAPGWNGFKINDLSNFKENTEYEIVVNVYKNELVGDEKLYIISDTSETQTDKDIFYADASNSINIIPGQLGKFTYYRTSLSDFSNCECVLRTVLNIGVPRCVECTIEIYEVGVCKANIRIQNPNAPIFGKGGRL